MNAFKMGCIAQISILGFLCLYWQRVSEGLRESLQGDVGCTPADPDTWLYRVWASVRFIFMEESVQPQTWAQWALGCHQIIRRTRPEWLIVLDFIQQYSWIGLIAAIVLHYRRSVPLPSIPVSGLRIVLDKMVVQPESLVAGSILHKEGKIPPGQVSVAYHINDELRVIGSGLRIENYLVTPAHNTFSNYPLFVVKGSDYAQVTSEPIPLVADVYAFALDPQIWARLSVPQCKLSPLKDMATVSITSSCDGQWSISTLRPDKPIGRTSYSGSTLPGFSGAAYASGKQILGMHTNGGANGGGYESLFLWCRLKVETNEPPEATEDQEDEAFRDGDFTYQDFGDGTDATARTVTARTNKGHYLNTSPAVISKYETLLDVKKRSVERRFADLARAGKGGWASEEEDDDYIPENLGTTGKEGWSGEGQRPAGKPQGVSGPAPKSSPKVSSSSAKTVQLPLTAVQSLLALVEKFSTKQPKQQGSRKRSSKRAPSTSQQTPQQQQSGRAS